MAELLCCAILSMILCTIRVSLERRRIIWSSQLSLKGPVSSTPVFVCYVHLCACVHACVYVIIICAPLHTQYMCTHMHTCTQCGIWWADLSMSSSRALLESHSLLNLKRCPSPWLKPSDYLIEDEPLVNKFISAKEGQFHMIVRLHMWCASASVRVGALIVGVVMRH